MTGSDLPASSASRRRHSGDNEALVPEMTLVGSKLGLPNHTSNKLPEGQVSSGRRAGGLHRPRGRHAPTKPTPDAGASGQPGLSDPIGTRPRGGGRGRGSGSDTKGDDAEAAAIVAEGGVSMRGRQDASDNQHTQGRTPRQPAASYASRSSAQQGVRRGGRGGVTGRTGGGRSEARRHAPDVEGLCSSLISVRLAGSTGSLLTPEGVGTHEIPPAPSVASHVRSDPPKAGEGAALAIEPAPALEVRMNTNKPGKGDTADVPADRQPNIVIPTAPPRPLHLARASDIRAGCLGPAESNPSPSPVPPFPPPPSVPSTSHQTWRELED